MEISSIGRGGTDWSFHCCSTFEFSNNPCTSPFIARSPMVCSSIWGSPFTPLQMAKWKHTHSFMAFKVKLVIEYCNILPKMWKCKQHRASARSKTVHCFLALITNRAIYWQLLDTKSWDYVYPPYWANGGLSTCFKWYLFYLESCFTIWTGGS